jgi:hypothetical protein
MITAICAGPAATLDPSARAHRWPCNSETGTGPNSQRHCAHACASSGALSLSLLQAVHRQVSQTDNAMRRTESNPTRKSTQKPSANLHKMREPEPPDEASTGGIAVNVALEPTSLLYCCQNGLGPWSTKRHEIQTICPVLGIGYRRKNAECEVLYEQVFSDQRATRGRHLEGIRL